MDTALLALGVIAAAGTLVWIFRKFVVRPVPAPLVAAPAAGKAAPAPPPKAAAAPAPPATPGPSFTGAPGKLPPALPGDHPQYALTLETGALECNPAFLTAFGYPPSEPAKSVEWWTDHIHPDDALRVNEVMNKLLDRSISRWTTEYRFQKADGSYVVVRDSSVVQRSPKGEAVRLVGVVDVNPELGSQL